MKDIKLDASGELIIQNGDFLYGDPTTENQRLLLLVSPGENKKAPLRGVGIRDFQDDERPQDMVRTIKKQFARDGMRGIKIEVVNSNLSIQAYYE
jgi:hypothetical protein